MNIELLITTLNKKDEEINTIISSFPKGSIIVGNQCDSTKIYSLSNSLVVNSTSRGVSISRNNLLRYSSSDLIMFFDDDVVLIDNYKDLIDKEFSKFPKAEAIYFNCVSLNKDRPIRTIAKSRKAKWKDISSYGVWGLVIKRETIVKYSLRFNELFGPGSRFKVGEDSLYLKELLKKCKNVYVSKETLVSIKQESSSWFTGYNKDYFYNLGAIRYKLFPHSFYYRKWKTFLFFKNRSELSRREMFRYMNEGKKDYLVHKDDVKSSLIVSVAMVTYNSSRFIRPQLETIIKNLRENDELVISDDGSSDDTISIIQEYMSNDKRIKLYKIKHLGCNGNYENAISHCIGDIIFLSDDDNVWEDNKIEKVLEAYEKDTKVMMVMHDCSIVDENLNLITNQTFFENRNAKPGLIRNIVKGSYGGSLMSFRKELVKYILPFPNKLPCFYDEWIGMMACKHAKVIFLKESLSKWRRYSGTNSTQFVSADGSVSNKKKYAKKGKIKRIFVRIDTRIKKLWLAIFH